MVQVKQSPVLSAEFPPEICATADTVLYSTTIGAGQAHPHEQ